MLWHANGQARQNVLTGIDSHLCGHPFYNPHADASDFSNDCDWIGLVCPGLPHMAQKIAHKVGHLMSYGEGYHAGVFLSALYAAAFMEADHVRMIRLAQQVLPVDSLYARHIDELVTWYEQQPEDWRVTWQKLEAKWEQSLCPWAQSDHGCSHIHGAECFVT